MNSRSEGVERAAEWVYRGVWRGISAGFKVPEGPPVLPAGGTPVRSFHPSPDFLRYMKLYFWIAAILMDLWILGVWLAIAIADPVVGAFTVLPALVLAIVPDIIFYIALHLRYDTTWYVMDDRSLRSRRGVWNLLEHTITFENVQNVHLSRGPVQYLFGIWTIVVETAGAAEGEGANRYAVGNKMILEGIADPTEIREIIMERVRRSRGVGLGDHRGEEAPTARSWSPAHLDVMREILAGVQTLRTKA